jgi:GNAT superfamily N-acetyltransferase
MEGWPPWALPEEYGVPHNIWMAARNISDEPAQSWTFPRFIDRVVAATPKGIDHAYEDLSSWDEVHAALFHKEVLAQRGFSGRLGLTIILGMELFDSALRSVTGRLSLPTADDHYRGRHVVATVGFEPDGREIAFRNSWGERWGDHGLGYVTRSYFEKHVDAIILKRPTWIGPSPKMSQAERQLQWSRGTIKSVDPVAYFEAWFTPNPIRHEQVTINGDAHNLRRRMLYTFANHLPFDVVELRRGEDFCGRMHVIHDRLNAESMVPEIWLPPSIRRLGYGRYLESVACTLATDVGTSRIRLLLNEADAGEIGQPRAVSFAQEAGYEWTSVEMRRPNIVGTAAKDLR